MSSPLSQRDFKLAGLALLLLLAISSFSATQTSLRISSTEELKEEFADVPCKGNRMLAVRALFQKMGAKDTDIAVEKINGIENLVVRKPGASADLIVIGAHYDKVIEGCGAIDNWTGIVTIAHMYRTFKDLSTKKTLLFVAFGNEESGLLGSHAMVNHIEKSQLEHYCAMINIDSFGMSPPQVLDNASSRKLTQLAADTAGEMKVPFHHAAIMNADADSSSFLARKIPALTLHGLSNDWARVLHTGNDQADKINPSSVYLGYRLALALLTRVDAADCTAFR
jgi:Peptidase family M28